MRVPFFVYVIIFVLIVAVLFFVGRSMMVREFTVSVDDLTGTAELQAKGKSSAQPLALNQVIRIGDEVRTGPDSQLDLLWPTGTHVRLGPNTRFEITLGVVNNAKRSTATEAKLSAGKVWVRLSKGLTGTGRFRIKTPVVETLVRGTIYSVEFKPDGSVQVETYEGKVGIQRGREGLLLRDETYGVFSKGKPLGRALPLSKEQLVAWLKNPNMTGAFLTVEQPQEGAKIAAPLAVVSGRTDPGNVLEVNGMTASVDREGKWTTRVSVNEGKNTITIHAVDAEGRESNLVRNVTR